MPDSDAIPDLRGQIDNDVMKLVRKKKSLWKGLKNNSDVDVFSRFKLLRRETKSHYH